MPVPEHKIDILNNIVRDLSGVENVAAIVLGGSHCMGLATDRSDLDIGIYYRGDAPFSTGDIRSIAEKYSSSETITVTGFYEWGAWVNGGAWIDTASGEIDFIYRHLEQVQATIENAVKGIWQNDFEQQPPYGFSSTIYLAETHYCQPLYDPHRLVAELKEAVKQYPRKLKEAIVQQALWSAEFSLWQADKFAAKNDIYNTAGCFTRIVKSITDALFALNETYPMGDKGAMQKLAALPICPPGITGELADVLTFSPATLQLKSSRLRLLFNQVVSGAGDMYRPYFTL